MTAEQATEVAAVTADSIRDALLSFLAERVKTTVTPDQDLFGSGLVSSMFAMQLVVHLEEAYDISVVGPELKLDNFRTVDAMSSLVLRLRETRNAAENA